LKYFSLGDSMGPGKEVCTFVVNCLCRDFFMDERPTVSRKHYFFSRKCTLLYHIFIYRNVSFMNFESICVLYFSIPLLYHIMTIYFIL
jgi:hypothetical protein